MRSEAFSRRNYTKSCHLNLGSRRNICSNAVIKCLATRFRFKVHRTKMRERNKIEDDDEEEEEVEKICAPPGKLTIELPALGSLLCAHFIVFRFSFLWFSPRRCRLASAFWYVAAGANVANISVAAVVVRTDGLTSLHLGIFRLRTIVTGTSAAQRPKRHRNEITFTDSVHIRHPFHRFVCALVRAFIHSVIGQYCASRSRSHTKISLFPGR